VRWFRLSSRPERKFALARLLGFAEHQTLERELASAWPSNPLVAVSRELVAAELLPFAGRRVNNVSLEHQWQLLLAWDSAHALRLRWDGAVVSSEGPRVSHERALWLAWAVELAARACRLPEFDLLVSFGDRLDQDMEHAPVASFCRRDSTTGQVLVPDFEFLRGHHALERRIDRASERYGWSEKLQIAFWRGVTTGGRFDGPDFREIPRARLVLASLERPDVIDARFTALKQGAENNPLLREPRFSSAAVSPPDSLRFRYLVDVDGNSSSWARMVWLLRSNSAVLKQRSPFRQWYYPWLKPGLHFVELAPDLADLTEVVLSLRARDEEAQAVALAGATFARERLSTLAGFLHLATVLEANAALQT
jgi:hypothetical protein